MFELKQAALAFIDENASVVIKSESFQKLSYNALIEIIKRDSFAAKEIEIFNAVVNWVNANRIEENKNSELFKNIRLSIIDIDDLLGVIRSSEIFTLETIVDAITEQRKNSHENKKRRIFVTNNVATIEKGAKVIEGFAAINDPDRNDPTAVLFNGDLTAIGDKNFVYHNTNGALTIQLDQVYLLSSMRFLLWNGNDRIYKSYGIEVSTDHDSWNKLCENNDCKSWQIIRFDQQAVRYIRITGTGNTDNEGFHIIHFECPSTV
uniref:BACK domain-containing protein n=1 Tax=Acrobeloides nanus TaxID=290746 RepID=A0A914EC69_9BILA